MKKEIVPSGCSHGLLPAAVVLLVAFCGCDPLGEKAEQKRQQEEARTERIRVESATETQARAMSAYLEGRIRLVSEKVAGLAARRAEVVRDQQAFARITVSETPSGAASDALERRASQLAGLFKSSELNELARRYMATDFTSFSSALLTRLDEALREEKAYSDAIAKAESTFESSVSETREWGASSRKQRDAEIERLSREIAQLERKREEFRKNTGGHARHTLAGGKSVERARSEEKSINVSRIYELDDEIDRRRKDLDYLRSPEARQRMQYRSESEAHTGRRDAANLKRNALYEIDRRLKPKKSVLAVLAEYEHKTIDALREAMQTALRGIDDDSRLCEDDLMKLKSYALAVPVSDLAGLRDLKAKADQIGERKRR